MIDVFTEGSGPFVTPLLARFVSLTMTDDPTYCLLEFELEDGARLTTPIASPAAFAAWAALSVYNAKRETPPASTN